MPATVPDISRYELPEYRFLWCYPRSKAGPGWHLAGAAEPASVEPPTPPLLRGNLSQGSDNRAQRARALILLLK